MCTEQIYQIPGHYLPTVGSTCTIETSSSPIEQPQDMYEYVPEESFIHEEIVTTSTSIPSPSHLPNRFKILSPTTVSVSQGKRNVSKRANVAMIDPQFEEEDYEDEEDYNNTRKNQRRLSSEKAQNLINNDNSKLQLPTVTTIEPAAPKKQRRKQELRKQSPQLNSPIQKTSSPKIKTQLTNSPTVGKKLTRKQELPTSKKKETLTSHLINKSITSPTNTTSKVTSSITDIKTKNQAISKKETVILKKEPLIQKKEPVIPKKELVIPKKEPLIEKKEPAKKDFVIPKKSASVITKKEPMTR